MSTTDWQHAKDVIAGELHMPGMGCPRCRANLEALTTQRDALLEALRDIAIYYEAEYVEGDKAYQAAIVARSAIKAAESHQPARQADGGPPSSACRRSEPT